MDIDVVKKDDGYWLVLNGKLKATIHLGTHGEIVTAALEEAAQQSYVADGGYCPHCDMNSIFDGCCINCGVPASR